VLCNNFWGVVFFPVFLAFYHLKEYSMEKLVFATNNLHKLNEVRAILKDKFEILSLQDIQCFDDIPETADTLEGNALQKATWVKEKYGYDCFADDTGLEVEALGGAPGVYSARYAGPDASFNDNCNKLLNALDGEDNRKAAFRTSICLIRNNETHYFEGKVEGEILKDFYGEKGFGYDPIFQPNGYNISFAQMLSEEKNRISHRGLATQKLMEFLGTV
jgi:XTP/dITP diphosphohydrolase